MIIRGVILQDKTKLLYIDWAGFKIDIYEGGKPDWFIHPIHREKEDVIALELNIGDRFTGLLKPINKIKFQNFSVTVADDIFILGFPYAIKGGGYFTIRKRGSVATEPVLNLEDLPKFYVDTASKKGMSGAPVVYS